MLITKVRTLWTQLRRVKHANYQIKELRCAGGCIRLAQVAHITAVTCTTLTITRSEHVDSFSGHN